MSDDNMGIFADSIEVDSIVRPEKTQDEILQELTKSSEDRALRPTTLADYVGQNEVKEQLSIALEAARKRGEALDHVLIFGPPGLGRLHCQILLQMSCLFQYHRPQDLHLRKKVMPLHF